jgi:hypothetical protein
MGLMGRIFFLQTILNFRTYTGKFSLLFLFAFLSLNIADISAQVVATPDKKVIVATTPKPTPKSTPKPTSKFPTPGPIMRLPRVSGVKTVVLNESDMPAEKSIATDEKVNVYLCITEGNVRINSWERDEVRAFVSDGSQVGFSVGQKDPKSGKPALIYVLGYEPRKNKEIRPDKCLSGSDIELDVPRNAYVNIEASESEITVDSIRKAAVKTAGGNIFLRNIVEGISASTYEGSVTVEKSSGGMVLTTTNGNIVAFDVSPSEIGDSFKAKALGGGTITLQEVEYRRSEISTSSGAIRFSGEILSGGQYKFGSQNGSIVLFIPLDCCAKVNASLGFGSFDSEIPLQNSLKRAQSLTADMGSCEATPNLNFTTYNGRILIRKKN